MRERDWRAAAALLGGSDNQRARGAALAQKGHKVLKVHRVFKAFKENKVLKEIQVLRESKAYKGLLAQKDHKVPKGI